MNIGFDLDGVVVSQDTCFLRLVDLGIKKELRDEIINFYYTSRTLLLNPLDFISPEDRLFIITGRSLKYANSTVRFVDKYFPNAELIMLDNEEPIDVKYKQLDDWYKAQAERKAKVINEYNIEVYFEDCFEVVKYLRGMCPNSKIIHVSIGKIDEMPRMEKTKRKYSIE